MEGMDISSNTSTLTSLTVQGDTDL